MKRDTISDATESSSRRRRAWRYGRLAETLCALSLRLRGYRIYARRYRTPVGEIDIVASRGDMLVFIEVKARDNRTDALYAVGGEQRNRIARAAEFFRQRHPRFANRRIRFDAMLVSPRRWPAHVRDAWRDGEHF